MDVKTPRPDDLKWPGIHWVRIGLYILELLRFCSYMLWFSLMRMGHGHSSAFGVIAYRIGLGLTFVGTVLVVRNLRSPDSSPALWQRLSGLFLHAIAIFAIIDEGVMQQ